MPQERLPLRKIREVIRLHHETDLSNRAIARACRISNSTVGEYLARAEQVGLVWPLPGELDEDSVALTGYARQTWEDLLGAARLGEADAVDALKLLYRLATRSQSET